VYCNDYRWSRVQAYLDADGEHQARAYHASQSVMAIGSGGVWGKGLGYGTTKLGWVPEDTTDFVFTVIGEELGLVGCGMVIGLFLAFIAVTLHVYWRAPDSLARYLTVAIGGTVAAQAAMNLLVVTGLAPTKGIALPFVSAGGTGLVITAAAVGVLINIARQQTLQNPSANTE
jgi:cell division protein FtsW